MVAICSVVSMVTVVGGWCEEHLLGVVPAHVGENAILDVATEDTLLGEGYGVLERIVSPAVHSAEEQGAGGLRCNVLVKVELEQLLGSFLLHHSQFNVTMSINY